MTSRNLHPRRRNRKSGSQPETKFAAATLRRFASLLLTVCLLSSATPAAPQTIVGVASEWRVGFAFWLRASGATKLLAAVQGRGAPAPRAQEKQEERNARVFRLLILPGDVTIHEGEQVSFAAVAYDREDSAVGGVSFTWSAHDDDRVTATRISPRGDFEARVSGNFKITVEGAGRKANVKVRVLEGDRRRLTDKKPGAVKHVSNRDDAPGSSSAVKKDRRGRRAAHATKRTAPPSPMLICPPDDTWNDCNWRSSSDPDNRRGTPLGGAMDGGAGSGNFQMAAPVYGSPSRGINISLGLAYNARLWNKSGSQINFDIDRDWPAPGWSLGFGKLLGMGVNNGAMLVDADGTRHSYTGTITPYSWGTNGVMHTTDGSFIDYTYWTGTGGSMTSGQAKLPNGTVISYGASSGHLYPTRIEDAQGNYITITYVNNTGPQLQAVTDTMGRVINFYYDANNLLTAITAAGLNGGPARTLVRLHYRQLLLDYNFFWTITPVVRNSYPWVIDAIYYPSTSAGYWFGDSDSYSSYGMIAKVVEQRGMTFSAALLNDMGTVGPGQMTQQELYNYPLSTADPHGSGLIDAPTYSSMTETWTRDGVATDQATTTFGGNQNASPRTVSITLPNGTTSTQYSHNSPGTFLDGLIYLDETRDSAGNLLQSSSSTWAQGAYDSPRPTRVENTDERGQTTPSDFIYGAVYNQVTEVRNDDYGGLSLLRSTRTQYQNATSYTGRHIFNLPLTVEVYGPDNVTRVSRTDYQYDGQTLTDAPGVVMHDDASNPYAPQLWVDGYWDWQCSDQECPVDMICRPQCWQVWVPGYWTSAYNSATDYRGNVTQVTSYADAINLTGAVTETHRYDVTGNMVTASTSCCQQTSFNYTIDTQYAYPLSKTRGSATDAYAQMTTSATYDFYTGLGLSATDASGRQSQTSYDANTLRPTSAISPTGAHTDYTYDDAGMTVTSTTYPTTGVGGAIADQSVKYLNGHGQVRQEKALGVSNVWDFVDTVYDNLGRVSQQTRPYRSGETQQWSSTSYDALGRTISVTAPDGSVTQTFYNEATRPDVASGNPGETTRVQDAWGRERWGRTDASGRLVEVVEPNPSGGGSVANGSLLTTYTYNTLGNLTQINQGAQTRSFKYDSLGRLTAQKLAEMSPTLNDAGTYVGSGTWSDVFTYDDRSNLTSRTDARGVKNVYTYNSDPLNRLQSVSWDTTGFGDTANPVLAAATVTYQYRTKDYASQLRDITQLSGTTAAGVSTESYGYDSEGRVYSKSVTVNGRPSMDTNYSYDSLDRATDVLYPAESGNGSALRKVVHHDYDVASRLTGLTFDGQSHASNIVYNAASQTTSLVVGASTANPVNESYNYNAQTGLLDDQTFTRGGTTLLNLSYDYANPSGKRTGQLTKILNNQNHNKDRGYEYDALGRLQRATGGQNVNWVQRYEYDRYGNRNNVFSYTADQYVKNFYQSALNRQPTTSELQSWLGTLQSAYAQGQSQFLTAMQNLGDTIFSSQEYANRNRSDRDYVYDLYKAYLLRDPEQAGWDFWTALVPINGRAAVRNGFNWSTEYSLKVNGTSPYSPPGGATVPADGLTWMGIDSTSNRLNGPGFAYDAAGNQTRTQNSGGVWQRFQYDAANRLVKVKADDNVTVLATYTYGDSNERLIAEEGGLRTYYDCEGGATIAEYTESGGSTTPAWSKSYVYLGIRLLATLTPNGSGGEAVEYHHPDRLGTRLVTNPSTGTSFEQVTLPFGSALDNESTGATNRRFTSYDRSATTGLDYANNRHYDSQQGRFTQVDPIGMNSTSLANPQTLNLYAYCANDPINHTDPSGLGFFSWLGKLFKSIGKVLSAVGNAIARVLNNRWVRIGVLILGFLVPFLGALAKAIQLALKIYNIVADIAGQMQLYGMLLQGKFKQLGMALLSGFVGSFIATIENGIIEGLHNYIGDKEFGGQHYIDWGKFSFKDFFNGVWHGLKTGLRDAANQLLRYRGQVKDKKTGLMRNKSFWEKFRDALVPGYGHWCGPGIGQGAGETRAGVNGVDEGACRPHDGLYNTPGQDKLGADFEMFGHLLIKFPTLQVTDLAFGGPSIGSRYKFSALPFFGAILPGYRYVTGSGRP